MNRKSSFKEILNNNPIELAPSPRVFDNFDVSDNDKDDGGNDPKCPTIRVTVEEKRRLRRRWYKLVIIKLLGHAVGFNFLVRRL